MRRRHALIALASLLVACGPDGEPLGTSEDALIVCPGPTTLEGIDISHYDGTIDWAQVKASGRSFAFAKATEGTSYTDPTFATNWGGMKQSGIVRSAYHFFHCDTDPVMQASHFIGVVPALQPGDLPPTLDFEDTTTCSSGTGIALAVQWLDAVAQATGTLPILYTSPGILGGFSGTQSLAGHAQLWVANWGVSCPDVPSPFTTWPFWQYSATGTVPGISGSGDVDLDRFDGNLAALLALTASGSSSTSSSSSGSSSTSSSSSSGTPPPSCQVMGVNGTCIDTSVCAAMPGYHSTPGYCPGPASEECCTPTGGSSSSSSSTTSSGATATGSSTSSSSGGAEASGAGGAATTSSGAGATGASGASGSVHVMAGCSASPTGEGAGSAARAWLAALALAAFARRARRRSS